MKTKQIANKHQPIQNQVKANNSHKPIIEGGRARHKTQTTLFKLKNTLKTPQNQPNSTQLDTTKLEPLPTLIEKTQKMNSNTNQDYPIKNNESLTEKQNTSSINKDNERTSHKKKPKVSAETNPNTTAVTTNQSKDNPLTSSNRNMTPTNPPIDNAPSTSRSDTLTISSPSPSTSNNKTTSNIETDNPQSKQHSNRTDNNHYCIEINSIHKPIVEPIVGKMIIGETLVNYLCDGGADITIINENLLNKIKTSNKSNEITPYNGKTIQSCSGEINVFGTITVSQLVIEQNPKKRKNNSYKP